MNKPTDSTKYPTVDLLSSALGLLSALFEKPGMDLTNIRGMGIQPNPQGKECLVLECQLAIPLDGLTEALDQMNEAYRPAEQVIDRITQEFQKHGLKPPHVIRVDQSAEKFAKIIQQMLKEEGGTDDTLEEISPEPEPVC